MTDTLTFLGIVATAFVFVLVLTTVEARRQKRVVFGRLRGWLDRVLGQGLAWTRYYVNFIVTHLVQLSWHYGLHALLKGCLWCLASLYGGIERVLRLNRRRARQLRKQQAKAGSYFRAMADHKTATNLSESERVERRRRELESSQ